MMVGKPRIVWSTEYDCWWCSCRLYGAGGETPLDAYGMWLVVRNHYGAN